MQSTKAEHGISIGMAGMAVLAAGLLFSGTESLAQPLFPGAQYHAGNRPASVAIGDLNADQLPDLVVANSHSDTASVLPHQPRPCHGDLNCDGFIDSRDIDPFVLMLSNWPEWLARYPDCLPRNADVSADGLYGGWDGFGDINAFVDLLASGQGQPIPCP